MAYKGQSREFVESSGALLFTFGISLLLVFLVLAAQFESFLQPVVILLAVPLAVCGGLGGLWLFGQSLNIYSQIALVILIGLATKNGILIVEFANQLRDEGRSVREAVLEASVLRLRPILMTGLSTALGALPPGLRRWGRRRGAGDDRRGGPGRSLGRDGDDAAGGAGGLRDGRALHRVTGTAREAAGVAVG